MTSKSEKIWYEDITGFLTARNYYYVLPLQTMTLEEKLNATVRFFVYLGVVLAVLKRDYRYLFFGIVASLLSILLYGFEQAQKAQAEKFLADNDLEIVDNQVCVRSTVDNPFMNPTLLDIAAGKPAACSLEHDVIKEVVEKNFQERLFKDVSDLYGKFASQRQFYTMPSTTIPNDQTGFATWCFGKGATCKENNGVQCYDNLIENVQRRV